MATQPETTTDADPPKVPFLMRRSGDLHVFVSPLTREQIEERFALYIGSGKSRSELARVQGRTVVAKPSGEHVQFSMYKRYLLGILTTAFCVVQPTPTGTRVLVTLSTLRYRRVYSVAALVAIIAGILIFAPASLFWMRSLLAFGILLVMSSWRLSKETRETREEKRFLSEFLRNLLDAEERPSTNQQRGKLEATAVRGRPA